MNTVERIKVICKERKIAISTLEKACGFSNGYIGQLKKGYVPDNRLLKIADYLNIPFDYLATGEENPKKKQADEFNEFIMLFNKLNDKDKENIVNLMKSLGKDN